MPDKPLGLGSLPDNAFGCALRHYLGESLILRTYPLQKVDLLQCHVSGVHYFAYNALIC